MTATRVTQIAAVARNGVIGADGAIPWHLPEDWAHFKATTLGHTLVMGRATHQGIGGPLPGRTTIVLTHDPGWTAPGVQIAHGIQQALELADGEVFVAGGALVYAAAMPYADAQVLSEIDLEPDGDTLYPGFDRDEWREVGREPRDGFAVVRWERVGS